MIDSPGDSRSIVVIRHGETDWNHEGRFQGHQDVPLNSAGIEQARAAAAQFRLSGPVTMVTSDLQRARRTAAEFAAALDVDLIVDRAFRETSGGRWERRLRAEIMRTDGDRFLRWINGEEVRAGETGELLSEVGDRMISGVNRYLGDVEDGGTLVIVTHGGAARTVVGGLIGLPAEHWQALGVLGNCATARLGAVAKSRNGRAWRLVAYNL